MGTTTKDFYYKTKQFAEFRNIGFGTHSFNYQPILVEVLGRVGISSIEGKTFEANIKSAPFLIFFKKDLFKKPLNVLILFLLAIFAKFSSF